MSDIIKKLIEKRTLEAAQKQLSQKLRCIARFLGSEIIGESYMQTFLPDAYDNFNEEEILNYDEENVPGITSHGYVYDTLKHGVNIEIVMMIYGDKVSELKCSYNGNIVFKEEDGQLQSYFPDVFWEKVIESQWERSKRKEIEEDKNSKKTKRIEDAKKKESLLTKLRRVWGL